MKLKNVLLCTGIFLILTGMSGCGQKAEDTAKESAEASEDTSKESADIQEGILEIDTGAFEGNEVFFADYETGKLTVSFEDKLCKKEGIVRAVHDAEQRGSSGDRPFGEYTGRDVS